MRIYLILLCLLPLCTAFAEPGKALEALRSALQAERKNAPADSSQQQELANSIALISEDYQEQDESGSPLLQNVEQIRRSSSSEKIKKLCTALITEIREQAARNAKALREKADATLRSALTRGLNATQAQDLDAPLMEVAKLQKEPNRQVNRWRELGNMDSFQAVGEILKAIQDGFLLKSKSRSGMNGNPVERIVTSTSSYTAQLGDLMPRSELIEKLQAIADRITAALPVKPLTKAQFETQIKAWIAEATHLDDMGPLLAKIETLVAQQQELNSYYGDSGLTSQLQNYRRVYENFRDGIGTSLSFAASYSSQNEDKLNDLKNLLVKFALPRVLGTPKDFLPKDDESTATFLQRALDLATKTSDWELMARVLDTATTIDITGMGRRADTTALRDFLGGLTFERARQFENAVVSYSTALKSGSSIVPAEKIGDKLEAIKKAHPFEYENGVQLFNSPPENPFRRRIVISGMPPNRTTNESNQPRVLNIPAAPKDAVGSKPTSSVVKEAEESSPGKAKPATKPGDKGA